MFISFFPRITDSKFMTTDANFNNKIPNNLDKFFENNFLDHLFAESITFTYLNSSYNEELNDKINHLTFLNLLQSDNLLDDFHEKRSTSLQNESLLSRDKSKTTIDLLEPAMNIFYLEGFKEFNKKNVRSNQILYDMIDKNHYEENKNLFNFIIKTINSPITFSKQFNSFSSHFINNENALIPQFVHYTKPTNFPKDFNQNDSTNNSLILSDTLHLWSQNNFFQLEQEKDLTIGDNIFFNDGFLDFNAPLSLDLMSHELTHVGQQKRLNQNFGLVNNLQDRGFEIQTLQNEYFSILLNSIYANYNFSDEDTPNFISSEMMFNADEKSKSILLQDELMLDHTSNSFIKHNSLHDYENNFQESNTEYLDNSFSYNNNVTANSSSYLYDLAYNFQCPPSTNDITKNSSMEKINSDNSTIIPTITKKNIDPKNQEMDNNPQQSHSESFPDIDTVIDQIYEKISERIQQERDRRGYR